MSFDNNNSLLIDFNDEGSTNVQVPTIAPISTIEANSNFNSNLETSPQMGQPWKTSSLPPTPTQVPANFSRLVKSPTLRRGMVEKEEMIKSIQEKQAILKENLEIIKGLDKQNKLEEKNLDLLKNYVNNILNFNLVKLNK